MTEKEALRRQIDAAAGRTKADLVVKNCRIVNVFSGEIESGEIAVLDGVIVGTEAGFEGRVTVDAEGRFAAPGFIDAHTHIESSFLSPEQAGRMLVPRGTATIVADPHEIANVCGLDGVRYMMEAAKGTKLSILFAMPSCVPATPFEDAGAKLDAADMEELLADRRIFGLGEFMNTPGVFRADDAVLDKLTLARRAGKIVDGHAPALSGRELNAYACAGILGDHECRTAEEIRARIAKGMYAMLREGSACHDLRNLLAGVTEASSRRALFCSDDCQPKTILSEGHIDRHLRICVEEGFDPVTAVRMATLNAAEAFRLCDRGAIAPGRRADIVLLDDLKDFHVHRVFLGGELVAEEGRYLSELSLADISAVRGSVKVRDFSADRLKVKLRSGRARVIGVQKNSIVTTKEIVTVQTDGRAPGRLRHKSRGRRRVGGPRFPQPDRGGRQQRGNGLRRGNIDRDGGRHGRRQRRQSAGLHAASHRGPNDHGKRRMGRRAAGRDPRESADGTGRQSGHGADHAADLHGAARHSGAEAHRPRTFRHRAVRFRAAGSVKTPLPPAAAGAVFLFSRRVKTSCKQPANVI